MFYNANEAVSHTHPPPFFFQVDVLAIGNGTACRETEVSFSNIIKDFVNVSYVIVDESGASIYRWLLLFINGGNFNLVMAFWP